MKAQVIIEFTLMFTALALLSMLIIQLIGFRGEEINQLKGIRKLNDFGLRLQDEVDMAYNSKPGYVRTFFLPSTINGMKFNISVTHNHLVVSQGGHAYYYILPKVNGSFKLGNNTIRNKGGLVVIN